MKLLLDTGGGILLLLDCKEAVIKALEGAQFVTEEKPGKPTSDLILAPEVPKFQLLRPEERHVREPGLPEEPGLFEKAKAEKGKATKKAGKKKAGRKRAGAKP